MVTGKVPVFTIFIMSALLFVIAHFMTKKELRAQKKGYHLKKWQQRIGAIAGVLCFLTLAIGLLIAGSFQIQTMREIRPIFSTTVQNDAIFLSASQYQTPDFTLDNLLSSEEDVTDSIYDYECLEYKDQLCNNNAVQISDIVVMERSAEIKTGKTRVTKLVIQCEWKIFSIYKIKYKIEIGSG